jgi:hypothetical protein
MLMMMIETLLGLDQLITNTFRMLCVWMQDNANIVKISKVLEELPEFFFF